MPALARDTAVGIIGAGAMGAGIAQVAVLAGHPVRLLDAREGQAETARDGIGKRLERMLEKDLLSAEAHAAAMQHLMVVERIADLAGCGLVIEAVIEDIDLKRAILRDAELAVSRKAILATNTSSLSITAIGGALEHPERLAGMHFFNPAPLMRLVEVISGLDTSGAVVDTLADTARAWGKIPVRAASTPGFIVNRVARPFYGEAFRLLAEHAADAATIDGILRDCAGFRMGPFELTDLIGQDVNATVTRSVFDAFHQDRRYQPSRFQEELVAAGRLGRKVGRGIYDYRVGTARPEPVEAPPRPAPATVYAEGDVGALAALLRRAREAGIRIEHEALGRGFVTVEGLALARTDGRLACECSVDADRPVALLDDCLDLAKAPRVALALPERGVAGLQADAMIGFLQAAGKKVSLVRDLPGLVVMRTVAMLANEAADAVHQGVAEADDIDSAMCHGVSYPLGPLAWAEQIGIRRVAGVIGHLRRLYGEDRYRLSIELHRRRLMLGDADAS